MVAGHDPDEVRIALLIRESSLDRGLGQLDQLVRGQGMHADEAVRSGSDGNGSVVAHVVLHAELVE